MENDYWRDPCEREEYYNLYASKYNYIEKECKACGQQVSIRTDHGICDSCADAQERGWQYYQIIRSKQETNNGQIIGARMLHCARQGGAAAPKES